MELQTDPRSPIMGGIYLLNPTAEDMRHAQKRAARLGLRRSDLTPPNRAVRRKLARRQSPGCSCRVIGADRKRKSR